MPQNVDPHCEVPACKRRELVLPDPPIRSHLVDEYQGNAVSSRIINRGTSAQLYCCHTVTAMPEPSWQIDPRGRLLRG